MYKYLLDHPSFSGMKLVVLTDPVPSTNYHNGNNNMPSIVWLREQKTHTIHLIVRLLIPLYLSIQAIPTGFLWESYQTPSRSNGCLIISDKAAWTMELKAILRDLVDSSTLFLWHPSIDTHLENVCSKFLLVMILRWRDMRNNINYTSPFNTDCTVIFMPGHRN